MMTAFATLAFLATIWLVTIVAAETLAESGGKIIAALKGSSAAADAATRRPLAVRVGKRSVRMQPSLRAQPKLRAAA